MRQATPWLKIVRHVTRKHGDAFAQKWFEETMDISMSEAYEAADVIAWPGYDPVDESIFTPAQQRFHAVEDEILRRTFAATRFAISEAFVKVAREVLARERRRQK